jgi:hypothetical protein
MLGRLAELIRGLDRSGHGYSRALQAARVRASYQRAYFAPALFNLIPVKTDMIASMAVDSRWRLYYNDDWLAAHTVEENAAVLIHEVSHLLREHEARKNAAAVRDHALWNTAADCEINDDLMAEGLPLPDDPPHPDKFGLQQASTPRRTTGRCSARAIRQRERTHTINDQPPSRLALRYGAQLQPPTAIADQAHTANGVRGNYRTMTAVRRAAGRRFRESGTGAARVRAENPGPVGRFRRCASRLAPMGGHVADARRWTTWPPSATSYVRRCATARSDATTARIADRIGGRLRMANSSCPRFTSPGPGPGS